MELGLKWLGQGSGPKIGGVWWVCVQGDFGGREPWVFTVPPPDGIKEPLGILF